MALGKVCDILQSLRDKKKLEPYINYIRFPYFRNLEENLRIDFNFPLTALVGQNGTNKSSILRAIYGCPKDYNVGKFWFSTSIDPITEEGGRPRFIYSYFQPKAKREVEVIKTRIQRVFKDKKAKKKRVNPDYWEPSRPILSDGMERMPTLKECSKGRGKTRWVLMKKEFIFIDFRSEISAFDRYFYHGNLRKTLTQNTKQEFIRSKSNLIKEAVDKGLQSKKMYRGLKEQITKNILLPQTQINCISDILGREYSDIRILGHKFFKSQGDSVILQSKDLSYSEAFAGSGEFAVVMLVHQVFEANMNSLIILDEPEVSLHPGAQERLVDFLLERIKQSKHQVVLGTHSPFILRKLPESAIKTLYLDPLSNKIRATNETLSAEAFFHLGMKNDNVKTIFVEDRLAAEVVTKALRKLGQAIHEQFNIQYPPGGASVLLMSYLPTYARTDREDVMFLMDGDQKPNIEIKKEKDINLFSDDDLNESLQNVLNGKVNIPVDGGASGSNKAQKRDAKVKILSFCQKYLNYIPGKTPEAFIWDNMSYDISKYGNYFDKVECHKECFRDLCRLELGKADYEKVTSEEIFQVQLRCLATVDNDLLDDLCVRIKEYLKK